MTAPTLALRLRAATAEAHEAVDAAFGDFALTEPSSYGRFLTAHARALPAAEAFLRGRSGLPPWRARTGLLAADLAALDLSLPAAPSFAPGEDAATAWGVLYVLEGSRLGGALMARSVPASLPSAYLGDAHRPGEWAAFRRGLEIAITDEGAVARATDGALACFELYRRAARDAQSG